MKSVKEIQGMVDIQVEEVLRKLYEEEEITTGDITPDMLVKWDSLTLEFAELLVLLREGNTPIKDNPDSADIMVGGD